MQELLAGYVCLGLSIYFFWRAINYLKLVRIIQDTPRSTIASTAQGMVEVKAKTLAADKHVLMVPRKNVPCAWYRYVKTQQYHDDEYSEPEIIESHQRFYIEDQTGKCAVDPVNAEIHSRKQYEETENGVKHEVSWIGVDESIYVLGWMQTLHPEAKTGDVITTRQDKQHRYGQLTDKLDRIARPPHGWLPFIISTHFEHQLVARFRSLFVSWATGGILLLLFAGNFITN